ncbi:MAG: tRNA (5-methylaminomethyl-2-thiouridine)(34)-methyltransferase MnmD [Phycisphaerales bacterium]|jgi:tRNA 5-methylaminomethyl-2-thiouridine biosynthesis bifunctional protein|nr:tRNA (5-methylaminomethyl-2-thiouridine)(34)-methyltransferase MnmD [Phycisphaerales bacterium]MBT7171369.1 tRNA (5-methylaminomethyl-2-thiouridine)(34)-methyltransferase MnmD [Phycisphaerales bacterium]
MSDEEIQLADCSVRDDGAVVSARFDDVYFDAADGLAESRAVFIEGSNFPDRWAANRRWPFTVFETGFGTGLNFLATLSAWRTAETPDGATLRYFAAEKFPVSRSVVAEALGGWGELSAELAAFLAVYPESILPGLSRWAVAPDVELIYGCGEVAEIIAADTPPIDAWLLDGFAPGKNPDMWRAEVFAAMATRSAPGATIATFTAAGVVKRGLRDAGFTVRRRPGHGKKWHRLVGTYSGEIACVDESNPYD